LVKYLESVTKGPGTAFSVVLSMKISPSFSPEA
jgi:hypothetical protein